MLQVKNGVILGETPLNDKHCHEYIETIAEITELEARECAESVAPSITAIINLSLCKGFLTGKNANGPPIYKKRKKNDLVENCHPVSSSSYLYAQEC